MPSYSEFARFCYVGFENKIFVQVPAEEKRRKLWFKAAHRADEPTNSNYYCCQDHFNVSK